MTKNKTPTVPTVLISWTFPLLYENKVKSRVCKRASYHQRLKFTKMEQPNSVNEMTLKKVLSVDGWKYQCPYESCEKDFINKYKALNHIGLVHRYKDNCGKRLRQACVNCRRWILFFNRDRHLGRCRAIKKLK